MTAKTEKPIRQPGFTLYLYSKADPTMLERRLCDGFCVDVAIQNIGPVPGTLRVPGKDDIAVVDIDYCGTEEQTAYRCVRRIREAGFTGPIVVNGDGNVNSSLLHVAGATHSVPVVHEEKGETGLRLAQTIVDVIKDLERFKKLVREKAAEGQPALELGV